MFIKQETLEQEVMELKNTGGSFSTTGTPTIIEFRWVIVDGDFTMDGGIVIKYL